jgi:hypothetical protein
MAVAPDSLSVANDQHFRHDLVVDVNVTGGVGMRCGPAESVGSIAG